MNRHFLHPGCILKTSPPSNDALWLFSFFLCWFSTLMIISKLLFIIAILVLCRVLQAKCVKSQYTVTIITPIDNLLCLQELCQAGRWGNLNAPARGGIHFLSFEYFWVQKILTELSCLDSTKQNSSCQDLNCPQRTIQSHWLLENHSSSKVGGNHKNYRALCRSLQLHQAFCGSGRDTYLTKDTYLFLLQSYWWRSI